MPDGRWFALLRSVENPRVHVFYMWLNLAGVFVSRPVQLWMHIAIISQVIFSYNSSHRQLLLFMSPSNEMIVAVRPIVAEYAQAIKPLLVHVCYHWQGQGRTLVVFHNLQFQYDMVD